MDVAPFAPLIGVDGKERFGALLGSQRREKCFGGFLNGSHRDAGFVNAEQARDDIAVAGNPFERLGGGR
ncbi:hypothetical protein D3C83_257850 [compost metagenome]